MKFEWYSCCQRGPFFGGERQHGGNFRGLTNYGKFNHTSYPENLTAVVGVSQLRNEPSYMCGPMLWTEIQQKMLQWSPMENQLRVLTQIYGHELEKFGTDFCIISYYRNLQNAQIKVSCILLLHIYLKIHSIQYLYL